MPNNVHFQISDTSRGEVLRREEIIHDDERSRMWVRLSHVWMDGVTPVIFLFEQNQAFPEIGFRVFSSRPQQEREKTTRQIDGFQFFQEPLLFDHDASLRQGRRVFNLVNSLERGGFLVQHEGVEIAVEAQVIIEHAVALGAVQMAYEQQLVAGS